VPFEQRGHTVAETPYQNLKVVGLVAWDLLEKTV